MTLDEIEPARELVRGIALVTPMEESRWLSALTGGPVSLKCENLQRAGSFKIRGAYTRISRLSAEERARGVVAASAGNHAQGVALAAQLLGIKATVFMPEGAPIPKERATAGYGADVASGPPSTRRWSRRDGSPRDRRGARSTRSTTPTSWPARARSASRSSSSARACETVVVPTGGGGLLAGIAVAVKATRPDIRVIGVQAEGAAAYPASLAAGTPVPLAVDGDDGGRHRGRAAR